MKSSTVRSIRVVLFGIAILLASIVPSLAPHPAYADSRVDPVLPVLLVHGFDGWGNSRSDWIGGGWISKEEFNEIPGHGSGWAVYKSIKKPSDRKAFTSIFSPDSGPVYSLDYHGYMDAKGGLKRNAGILSMAIDTVLKDSGATRVYVVAHSQGGLMTRAVMEGLAVDPGTAADPKDGNVISYKNNIFGFTTIDSPHKGTSTNAGFIFRSNGSFDMINDSPFMKELNASSVDEGALCSVVVGNAEGEAHGDALFSVDEQTPIASTFPSHYNIKKFAVLHGSGMNGVDYKNYRPALGSVEVRDWVVARYKEALKKYQEPNQPLTTAANTVLAIDHSGSMGEPWNSTTKVEGAKSAADSLVDILQGAAFANQSPVSIGLLQFNDQTDSLLAPTADYTPVRDSISPITADGGTDLIKPIEAGARQLESAGGGALILLTDGVDENGNSDDSIVAAADAARAKGITIFTIGFGTPGSDINEALLKRIAGDDSRYSYADPKSLVGLAGSFLYSQIAAVEQIFVKSQGTVQQGQTVTAGEFDVGNKPGNLQSVLYWPGSTLEIKLTDPSGTEVASGYPGLTIARTSTPAQMFIKNPTAGHWKMSVYGADTSMNNEPYYAITAFKETSAAPQPALTTGGGGTNNDAGLVLGVIVLAFAGGVGAIILGRGSARGQSGQSDSHSLEGFALQVASGPTISLKEGVNTVGRSDDQDIVLASERVSRQHAVVVVHRRTVMIRDVNSAAGVVVNGAPIAEREIVAGDKIVLGDVVLTLEDAVSSDGLRTEG